MSRRFAANHGEEGRATVGVPDRIKKQARTSVSDVEARNRRRGRVADDCVGGFGFGKADGEHIVLVFALLKSDVEQCKVGSVLVRANQRQRIDDLDVTDYSCLTAGPTLRPNVIG